MPIYFGDRPLNWSIAGKMMNHTMGIITMNESLYKVITVFCSALHNSLCDEEMKMNNVKQENRKVSMIVSSSMLSINNNEERSKLLTYL